MKKIQLVVLVLTTIFVISCDTPKETEVNAGHTCIKGRYAFGFYDHPDRLKTPLIKRNGKFEEASWEMAIH